MSKEIIINANMAEEVRIAIVEKNRLVDLDIETQSRAKHKGNIYKGIVANIEDSLDAAFIDFGEERQAFLPLSEVRPSLYPAELKERKRVKISEVFRRGQEVIVQVTKDEIGNKGAAVSTYLSIPGRYVVLMHSDESGGGISRKIESEHARKTAREILSHLHVPEGMAVIIRTAGMQAHKQDLFRDFKVLCETWSQIDKGAQLGRAPTLLYREPDIVIRTIRDYFSSDVSRIVIDDEEEFEEAKRYLGEQMPDLLNVLEHHKKKEPIFQHYGIEQAMEALFERQVKLPSGGYIIIEQTEALVSIDVNSGRSTQEEDHEATVYKTNLEAVDEIARQLRLRDLGGIIILDLIDMAMMKHRRDVEKRLREAMQAEKARVKIGHISENGILELTRQRIRQSHRLISHVPCRHCEGTGRVRDAEGLAVVALRRIAGQLTQKKRVPISKLVVRVPVEVANVLNNQKRRELVTMSDTHLTEIYVVADPQMVNTDIHLQEERRGQAGLDAVMAARDRSDTTHRSRGQRQESWAAGSTVPPPSIGPVPTIIDFEEIEKAVGASEEPILEPQSAHFDDPIMEALFGDAPDIELPQTQTKEQTEASATSQEASSDQVENTSQTSEQDEHDKPKHRPRRNRRFFSRKRYPRSHNNSQEGSAPSAEPSEEQP